MLNFESESASSTWISNDGPHAESLAQFEPAILDWEIQPGFLGRHFLCPYSFTQSMATL